MKIRASAIACCLIVAFAVPAYAIDEADATKLLKASKCERCHDVVKVKKGTPYQKTAADLKGNPNALAEVIEHLTKPKQVEVDGEKTDHGTVKTRDAARIRNLAEWILSR